MVFMFCLVYEMGKYDVFVSEFVVFGCLFILVLGSIFNEDDVMRFFGVVRKFIRGVVYMFMVLNVCFGFLYFFFCDL